MRAESRIETTTRVIYTLPSPAVWADVEAVFAAIRTKLAAKRLYDDTVRVEAYDDEIRISYESEQ